jgi:Ca2+-transporting ATPase
MQTISIDEKFKNWQKEMPELYQVVYDRYNRLRLYLPHLKLTKNFKNALKHFMHSGQWGAFSIRPKTSTLVIEFDPNKDKKQFLEQLDCFLKQPEKFQTFLSKSKKKPHYNTVSTVHWHALSADQVMGLLKIDAQIGIGQQTAQQKYQQFGANQLKSTPALTSMEILLNQFKGLPIAMLGASAAVSLATGGILDAALIAGVLGINARIGYKNDSQVEKTIHSLKRKHWPKQTVKRDGIKQRVATENLVPGDIIYLKRGQMVPADLRIIYSEGLTVDESALTGESKAILKDENWTCKQDAPIGDRKNMLYRGTALTGGTCKAIVVATGNKTQIGLIQSLIDTASKPQTPIQQQMDQLGTQLSLASIGLCGLSFGLGLLRGRPAIEIFKNSISLAVAAIPEGLPMVATTTLSRGVKTLRENNVLVRNLGAVEALGSVHHICLDKTGTITIDEMVLEQIYLGHSIFKAPFHADELGRFLEIVTLNNEVRIKDGTLKGSSTEKALMMAALSAGINVQELKQQYPLLKTVERSQTRHYMLTQHQVTHGKDFWTAKGNPKEVLKLCDHYYLDKEILPLTDEMRYEISQANHAMAEDTLRVLGVAFKNHPALASGSGDNYVWYGLVGLKDKIKEGINELIHSLQQAGIMSTMVTGDQSHTAEAIAKIIGLGGGETLRLVNVQQLDALDEKEHGNIASHTDVFSRVSPEHKLKIIQALQSEKRVVAMTGDGINDGPALKKADIGIAMGDQGSDVAIEVADVVLLDDNLQTILNGIREGRNVKENIKRAVEFILATNMSEIGITVLSQIIGLPEPCNAAQYLWINLLTDIYPEIALAAEPSDPDLLKRPPNKAGESLIPPHQLRNLMSDSAVMTGSALLSYLWGIARYGSGPSASSMAFLNLTSSQLYYMLGMRSPEPLWKTGLMLQKNKKNPVCSTQWFWHATSRPTDTRIKRCHGYGTYWRTGLDDCPFTGVSTVSNS